VGYRRRNLKAELSWYRYGECRPGWPNPNLRARIDAAAAAARWLRPDYERFLPPGAKANFDPAQPRDEEGRWTDAGGGNDRLGSDLQLVNDRNDASSPVSLEEEEASGGHTIEYHVSRSRESLRAQAMARFDREPDARDVRSGSFSSLVAADKLVNSTLSQNGDIVKQVAAGEIQSKVIISQFGSVTGSEVVFASARSQSEFRNTYGVGVLIYHDRFAPRGFRVFTAFPTNRRQ
jgi:hypothetical protein